MKILVLNAGSSSLKFQLFDMTDESILAKGNCEKIGERSSFGSYKAGKVQEKFTEIMDNHTDAVKKVLSLLTDEKLGVIKDLKEISAIGHRVVQGGWIFDKSVIVNKKVIKDLESLKDLSPLHSAANLAGIYACEKLMPKTKQVLVFDTSFHATMPPEAYMYGIKYEDYKKYHIRKYGFHGTSHRYVLSETARLLKKKPEQINMISMHLGNGSSICAIKDGKSIDTTMGLTPLEGLMMGTRSGDLDPTVVSYLCDKKKMTAAEVINYLNKECGLLGLTGKSNDMRDILKLVDSGDERAILAVDVLIYRIRKYLGAFLTVLGHVDAITFEGGMGENDELVRNRVLTGLEAFGIKIDEKKNLSLPRGTIEEISTKKSKVRVFRIPTDEELLIARDTKELVSK